MAEIDKYFRLMVEHGTSDLHLSVGCRPSFRKDGSIVALKTEEPLTAERLEALLLEITPEKNKQEFLERHDTDFAYELPGVGRFRANLFRDHRGIGGVFRLIPSKVLTFEELGLPEVLKRFCMLSKGLILVTGPTGSGKSTTLAAMIDYINKTRNDHIITIEDPIEFVHTNQRCLINQREVHTHTLSFKAALRAALREDPDIVLVGEMRDLETTHIAIETAETGHLVFGTLHTTTAVSTVDRLIDQFPANEQQQIRTMLAATLKGVVAQNLLKKKGGGRVAALEVLVVNPAVSSLIREAKTSQIMSIMQTGKKEGMTLLNDELTRLVKADIVEPVEAYRKAVDKEGFLRSLESEGIKFTPPVD
jgi:twitching motility protein PilT